MRCKLRHGALAIHGHDVGKYLLDLLGKMCIRDRAINAHFSNVAIPHQIAMLEQRTRELKALSIEILNLAKESKQIGLL